VYAKVTFRPSHRAVMNWIAWHEYSQPVLVWAWTSQKVSGHSSSESQRFLQGLRRAKMAMLQPRKDAA